MLLGAAFILVGVAASPSPLPAPSASAAAINQQVLTRAKAFLIAMQNGTVDRTQLTPQSEKLFTQASEKNLAGLIGPFGAPTAFTQRSVVQKGVNTSYVYNVTFANGTQALMIFSLDDATSKVSGLGLQPSP